MSNDNWDINCLDFNKIKNFLKEDQKVRKKLKIIEIQMIFLGIFIFPAFMRFNFYLYLLFWSKIFWFISFVNFSILLSINTRRTLELWQESKKKQLILNQMIRFSITEAIWVYLVSIFVNLVFYFSGFYDFISEQSRYDFQILKYQPLGIEAVLISLVIIISLITSVTYTREIGKSFLNSNLKVSFPEVIEKHKLDPQWIFTIYLFGGIFWVLIGDILLVDYLLKSLTFPNNSTIILLIIQLACLITFNIPVIYQIKKKKI